MSLNKKTLLSWLMAVVSITLLVIGEYSWNKFQNNIKMEQEFQTIDRYNFTQLEKVKSILDGKNINSPFKTFKEFNEKYGTSIKPMQDCYYMSSSNGKEPYIFGFKLYSKTFRSRYGADYYAYPKYDLLVQYACMGSDDCSDDTMYAYFLSIINDDCRF